LKFRGDVFRRKIGWMRMDGFEDEGVWRGEEV
jgi:hypothetical protein